MTLHQFVRVSKSRLFPYVFRIELNRQWSCDWWERNLVERGLPGLLLDPSVATVSPGNVPG
jgi:hypothetical protein